MGLWGLSPSLFSATDYFQNKQTIAGCLGFGVAFVGCACMIT